MSIATLEASRAGCPVVVADAGGNREGLPPDAVVVEDPSNIEEYVDGIERVLGVGRRPVATPGPDPDLVPRLWCLLGRHARAASKAGEDAIRPAGGTLFLTDNLNLGGAPRSLVNLLTHLPAEARAWLGVLNPIYCQEYLDAIDRAGVPNFSVHDVGSPVDKAERILFAARRLGVRNICFWNVDARVKLLIAKALPGGSVRLIDVSPGPWLFHDLERASGWQRRISLSSREYLDRVDRFVAKYDGGGPDWPVGPGKTVVIPNGVPFPEAGPPGLPEEVDGLDPALAIGAVCRIAPDKRVGGLLAMMERLGRLLPGAHLTVVGGADARHLAYWKGLVARLGAEGSTNVRFVGARAEIGPFLRRFKVFVMLSDEHGCPNASLEAMAMGIPVVANPAGGTIEQVEPGVNGFLVPIDDPDALAHRVRYLLTNPKVRERFGEAGRKIASERFSMARMVGRYLELFGVETPTPPVVPAANGRMLHARSGPSPSIAGINSRRKCHG